jgi:hypothetical protein
VTLPGPCSRAGRAVVHRVRIVDAAGGGALIPRSLECLDAFIVTPQLLTHRSAVVGNGVTLCRSGVSYRESSYNRFSDASCLLNGPGDVQSGVNFALGLLADNGGPVQTMLPEASSDLIDAIPAAACTLNADARGVSRPQGSGCDVGAVEVAR